MSDISQIQAQVDFDLSPPASIQAGGRTYRLAAPRAVRPPLPGTVKFALNWVNTVQGTAHNIGFLEGPTSANTSDTVLLATLADAVMAAFAGSGMPTSISSEWVLSSVTAYDAGLNTGAAATGTHAPIPGLSGTSALPPQCAVAISWKIAAAYRGGKPRWYLPGIPASALLTPGSSALQAGYAQGIEISARAIMVALQGFLVSGQAWNLGVVSYQTGHAARPVPIFRLFTGARCHSRLDSQRRRSGKESTFPVYP